MTFLSVGIVTSINMHVFSFFVFLFTVPYLCVTLDSVALSHLHVHILVWVGVCAYHMFVTWMHSPLHIE